MNKLMFLMTFSTHYLCLASEKIPETELLKLQAYKTYAIATLRSPGTNQDECTKNSAQNFVLISFDDGQEMYSAALSARVSGKPIGFGVSGCQAWGDGSVPKVYRVDL